MNQKIEDLKKVEEKLSNNFNDNLSILNILFDESTKLCSEDTSKCMETGLAQEINLIAEKIKNVNKQKELHDFISERISKLGVTEDINELAVTVDSIENYIERYPNCSTVSELYNFRDEVLNKKFWAVCQYEFVGSVVSSYAYDAILVNLGTYLVKVRNEKYRAEFSKKIEELKIERDRVRENEIEQERVDEEQAHQERIEEEQKTKENNIREHQDKRSRAFNSLGIAMENKAKSIASKGHSMWCFVTKISESTDSQFDSGNRTEIKKSYKFKIGGTCTLSYEYITVTGYVSDNGYDDVDYSVSGGDKN